MLQDKVRSLKNVDIILNAQTTEVKGDGSKVTGLQYRDRVSGDEHHVALAGIFVQIGLLPNTTGWKARLSVTVWARSSSMRSAKPTLKAYSPPVTAPPCRTSRLSSRQGGAKASLSAFDYLIRTKTA